MRFSTPRDFAVELINLVDKHNIVAVVTTGQDLKEILQKYSSGSVYSNVILSSRYVLELDKDSQILIYPFNTHIIPSIPICDIVFKSAKIKEPISPSKSGVILTYDYS